MISKSAIDRQRESAITLEVGGDDDNSQIREFLSLSHALYTITDQAVYRVLLADDIDPDRTNPNIPNQSQKVIPFGYNDPVVAKTLLTAKYLFDKNNATADHLLDDFFETVIDLTKHALELQKMVAELKGEISEKEDFIANTKQKPNGYTVPAITDLKTKVHNILVKADKAKDAILKLYKIHFLPNEGDKPKLEKYTKALKDLSNIDDEVLKVWEEKKKFLDLIRNARNSSEHPKPNQQVLLNDFTMQSDGSVAPPLVQIEHKDTPIGLLPLVEFIEFLEKMIIDYSELSPVFIKQLLLINSEKNPLGEWVTEFPEKERRHPHVRFYRSINMGGTERILG
ncbi:MAG: hypothetical protein CMH30_04390 [Micavibrio sp.]|nr:hypothetical protein [Micavibrio sp.]